MAAWSSSAAAATAASASLYSLHYVIFPKDRRLLKRKEFLRVSARHKRLCGKYLLVELHRKKSGPTRLGITVTRRYGNAVRRNRFKRLVREAFRQQVWPDGFDLVVRPRTAALNACAADVAADLAETAGHALEKGPNGKRREACRPVVDVVSR